MTNDDPMALSVEELVERGVDSVKAGCNYCGKSWSALIDVIPARTTLRKIRALMVCPTCGSADVDVEPNWPDAPTAH
ncbi:MAG: hypothetical protein KGM42_00490 [Hyphomicrobiales bacterium]|nr:hypothetical protein [Hyphomicrobiales bacterium]